MTLVLLEEISLVVVLPLLITTAGQNLLDATLAAASINPKHLDSVVASDLILPFKAHIVAGCARISKAARFGSCSALVANEKRAV